MKLYKAFGEEKTLREWSNEYNISWDNLYDRIRKGDLLEEALTKYYGKKLYKAFGKDRDLNQWAKEYNISYNTLLSRLKSKLNLEEALLKKNRNSPYTIDSETKRLKDWAKENNLTRETIKSRIKYGFKLEKIISPENFLKKNDYNENFFNQIDSEEKAYFLGFLWADGTIHKNGRTVTLEITDKEILIKLRNLVINNGKYRYKNSIIRPNGNLSKPQYILQMDHPQIYQDLLKLGLYNRKSLTIAMPTFDQVPEHLMNHFIRGEFDGDGCISVTKPNKILNKSITFCGSHIFCSQLKKYLDEILDCKLYLYKYKNHSAASSSNYETIKKFYNYIYGDMKSDLFLERKKNKFEKLFDIKENNLQFY